MLIGVSHLTGQNLQLTVNLQAIRRLLQDPALDCTGCLPVIASG